MNQGKLLLRGKYLRSGNLIFMILFLFSILILSCGVDNPSGLLELKLSGSLPEADQTRFLVRRELTVLEIIGGLKKAKNDANIKGLILKIGGLSAGLGKLGEVRDALLDFKQSGKPIYAFLEAAGNAEYFLSTAADSIYLTPISGIFLVGLRVEVPFYKGTFDKVGIKGEFLNIGDYKSAYDIYTRRQMSYPQREELTAILDGLFSQLVSSIAKSRELSIESVKQTIDNAPYNSDEAKELGLVDDLLYEDEFDESVKEKTGTYNLVKWNEYKSGSIFGRFTSRLKKIAVLYASGEIMPGESQDSPLSGNFMGSSTISKALQEVREDNSVKAVVLRIDSPGGSSLASDVIWREVEKTNDVKPVVVSMADVAASGGYWIATAADTIVCEPGTITGSIGVISGKFQFKGLYDLIDLNKEIIKRGDNATIFSDYTSFSAKERERLIKTMQFIYDNFLEKVAASQQMSVEEVTAVAGGRAWTGEQAYENGLVDILGGLDTAISLAKEMSGIPKEQKVEIITLPKAKGLVETIADRLLSTEVEWSSEFKSVLQELRLIKLFEKEAVLALMPYRFLL